MKKELEVFENRSDDWLGKEIEEESRMSVWDFDEGKRLKKEHQQRHQSYVEQYGKGVINQKPELSKAQKSALILPFVIIAIMFISIILQVGVASDGPLTIFPFIVFIFIAISLSFSKKKGGK